MTPLQLAARLERLRQTLRMLSACSVLTWALAAGAAVLFIAVLTRLANGAPSVPVMWGVGLLAAVATGAWRWRLRRPDRLHRLDAALWAEAQSPDLQYALVTLAEADVANDSDPVHQRLASYTTTTSWEHAVERAVRAGRVQAASRLAATIGVIALAAYPWGARSLAASLPGVKAAVARDSVSSRRVAAAVSLAPPLYTGRSARAVAFGETVTALVGSVIRVDGAGPPTNATLLLQESSDTGASAPRPVTRQPRDGGWRGVLRIGAAPLALRLRDAMGERWVLVTPVIDSAPVATLLLPTADTLVFDTTAIIRVDGAIHDDVALRDARIEYIISSGGGEQFTFRSGTIGERKGSLGRDVTLRASLDLGALGLKPGDLMHVRMTAHDNNTMSGPSLGASETRTIRIPRADERDSVSVEQLPPTPVDKSVLSQRQLLMLTERLVARIPRIDRAVMLAESNRIGNDQAKLRKQVADIVFARLGDSPSGEHAHFAGDGHNHTESELATATTPDAVLRAADRATGGVSGMLDSHGDETPVVAVNRPLLEAYNAMWDATRALQGGVPRDALDPMRRALAAIQRARSAERVYLRGTPPAAVIDLVKIRLIGTDSAKFEARRALSALALPERRLAERVLRAQALMAARDPAALDSMRLIRLDALAASPVLASALGATIEAVESGRDATDALLRARRLALAPWTAVAGGVLWFGGAP